MKGGFGRKKSESTNQQQQEETPPPPPPFDEEEKDVYDGEEEGEAEEENNQAEEEEVEERPKLAEGFFEIEDVRRKRIRKGKVQYLIKWRGWPETANTWEPVDNLQSCSDIIAAFEHRSSKTSKKRKRKQSITQTQPKKRQPRTTSTSTATQPSDNSLCQSNAAAPQEGVEEGKAGESTRHVEREVDNGHQGVEKISTVEHLAEDGPTSISVDKNRNKEADGVVDGEFSVQVPDTRSIGKDGVEEQSKAETLLANGFTGAKKRKSGRVRRFKQAALNELDDARHPVTRTTNGPTQAPEPLRDDALNEDNLETSVNPSSIVKIIKPMGFSTSVSNNVHDVSLTFRIRRSNGQEEVVDNNYLKVNNPLLLINFYEQHLRYSPPA